MAQFISTVSSVVWYVAIIASGVLAFRNIWLASSSKGTWKSIDPATKPALSKMEGVFFAVVILAVLVAEILDYSGIGVAAGTGLRSETFVFGWALVGQYLSASVLFRSDWDWHATVAVTIAAMIFAFVFLWCAAVGSLPPELHATLRAATAFTSVWLVLCRCNWFIRERGQPNEF